MTHPLINLHVVRYTICAYSVHHPFNLDDMETLMPDDIFLELGKVTEKSDIRCAPRYKILTHTGAIKILNEQDVYRNHHDGLVQQQYCLKIVFDRCEFGNIS